MGLETALFFETVEQIYARVFRLLKPRTSVPQVTVRFLKYANANSRIRFRESHLTVHISDLLEGAPAPVHEALAYILLGKLFGRPPVIRMVARYRRYLNRADVRRTVHLAKQQRGRKIFRNPKGQIYNLEEIFEELNIRFFHGLMARPRLGWSAARSRTALGHYDPSHNMIVLSSLFDSESASRLIVKFVLFHEMLHLKYPTEHQGTRRCVHTKAFKQAEKEFEGYQEAKAALRVFLESAVGAEKLKGLDDQIV
jgi:hypothetical protein